MKLRNRLAAAAAMGAALGLAACNTTRNAGPGPAAGPGVAPGAAQARPGPNAPLAPPALEQGSGCGPQIARFRAIIESDRDTGNVKATVYDQMSAGVQKASAACQGGDEGAALATLRATKTRFGYP